MAFFDFLKPKSDSSPKGGHVIDQEDREISLKLRQQRAELKTLELQRQSELQRLEYERKKMQLEDEIAEMNGAYDEEETNSSPMDAMLMQILTRSMGGQTSTGASNHPQSISSTPVEVNLTDEQINDFIKQVPKNYLKVAKGMDHLQLTGIIKGYIPNISNDSLNKVITIVKA